MSSVVKTPESTIHRMPWADSPIVDSLANPIVKGPGSETATKLHLSHSVSVSFMKSVDQILIYSFQHSTRQISRLPSVSSSLSFAASGEGHSLHRTKIGNCRR